LSCPGCNLHLGKFSFGARAERCPDNLRRLAEFHGVEWIAVGAPCAQATFQWANLSNAFSSEEQRHTGAGSFIRSSTVEDHFAVAGQLIILLFEFLRVHAKGPRNGFGVGFEVHGVSQIHDDEVFAGVDFFLQFFDANT
jgi:hypothetical protein